jgi:alpha-glucosidase
VSRGHHVVYQIYPWSFLYTTGSGVGDLDGATARLDHLVWLGLDAVCFERSARS